MRERDWWAESFEASRTHLRSVAYRMLGSTDEADDAVQEAWLRLSRTDISAVHNLGGWLTTVVGRICLDMLRGRRIRREESIEKPTPGAIDTREGATDPEDEALLADSVGLAMLVVLDTLTPAERLAFVLHDMFELPFVEIAAILDRSEAATKMLASRARRRIRAADTNSYNNDDLARQRAVVDVFLAASRDGDFEALLRLLDPEVVLQADHASVLMGVTELRGPRAVAQQFAGRALAARPALINGSAGAVWAPGGKPRVVIDLTIADGRIMAVDLIADPDRIDQLNLKILRNTRQTES